MTDQPSSSKSTRASRGFTKMFGLNKLIVEGKKLHISVSDDGCILHGPEYIKLMSLIGGLVRMHVPITIATWKEVDVQIKDRMWAEINKYFDNVESVRHLVMRSMGESWRTWKSKLYVKYVKDVDLEHRYNVPLKYNFITPEDWKVFVDNRSTPESMEKSKLNTERAKKQKAYHTTSRMGYYGLKKKMVEEQGTNEPISRAELWKAGHKRKSGEYISQQAAELAAKIDEVSSQESQEASSSLRRDDALASVLGQEHPGRVRAGGKHSTITRFFKDDKRRVQEESSRIDVEAIVQEKMRLEKESWRQETELLFKQQEDQLKQERLAYQQERQAIQQERQAHQQDMDNMKKQIDELMRIMGARTGTTQDMSQALVLHTETSHGRPETSHVPLPDASHECSTSTTENTAILMLPKFISNIVENKGIITLVLQPTVFGMVEPMCTFFDNEELHDFLNMKKVGANIILSCIGYIYSQLEKFENPKNICFHNPLCIATYNEEHAKNHMKSRVEDLLNRIIQLKEHFLLFVPYNRNEHWMLAILDSRANRVYWLDPLNLEIRTDISDVITGALRGWAKHRRVTYRKPTFLKWKFCPKQPDDVQCGYYIMCYMVDIVEALRNAPMSSKIYEGVTQFTQEKIDNMRNMICDYLINNCAPE